MLGNFPMLYSLLATVLVGLPLMDAQTPHDGVSQNFTFTQSPIDGRSLCAAASSSSVVVFNVTLNHAECATKCFNQRTCCNYNYFHNTTRCELFQKIPIRYSYEEDRCINYQVSAV